MAKIRMPKISIAKISMAKKVVTLFIRDTGITLLVMKGKQIEKWASLPLEPGLVSQGLIVDEAQVADKVKQLFKETGAQTQKVIVAVGGHDSLYRIITLPELPEAVLPEAVKREAKRTIPTPLEEVYLSYQKLPSPTKGECRIFLATFPRNPVDVLVRTLHQAGVSPYIMDLAPLALCRIPNEFRAIIVNARLEHLDVMVLADRLPQVIRRLTLPGEIESLEERLPLIAEEFKRTVAFYNSSHIEKPLDETVPVFVCGDLVEAPEAWPSVVSQAGYSVSPLPSPVELPEGLNANEFMVNIGLALKELLPEKAEANSSLVNFNALPEVYVPPGFSMARVFVPVGIAIGIGLIIFGVVFVQHNRAYTADLRSQLESIQSSVTQKQTEVATLNAQVGSVEAVADELDSRITAMEQGRANIYLDLYEIKTLKPEDLQLSSINDGGSSITVTGTAPNVGLIYSYARALKGSPRFSSVWVSPVSDSGTSFTIQFAVAR
ncbi:MAG: pilus assembly protein PilM [Dehalococcoidia bacterium]